jgi:hypothetical protein
MLLVIEIGLRVDDLLRSLYQIFTFLCVSQGSNNLHKTNLTKVFRPFACVSAYGVKPSLMRA